MNDTDPFIQQLHDRLSAQTETIEAPVGLADHARRRARRRVGGRVVAGAVPTLLAGTLAVILLTAGRSARSASELDAAYIAAHVSSQLARQDAGQSVLHSVYVNPPGGADSGRQTESWEYFDPGSGRDTVFSRTVARHGRPIVLVRDTQRLHHGDARATTLIVYPTQRTWARETDSYKVVSLGPGNFANDRQLRRMIARGAFTREGTVTVEGQPALKLRLRVKKFATELLYVNATTYRPIQETTHEYRPQHFEVTTYWEPATAANQARATRSVSVPSGYKRVLTPAQAQARAREAHIRMQLQTTTSPRKRRLLRAELKKLKPGLLPTASTRAETGMAEQGSGARLVD